MTNNLNLYPAIPSSIHQLTKNSSKTLTINQTLIKISTKNMRKDKNMVTTQPQTRNFGKTASLPFVIFLLDSLHNYWRILLRNDSRIPFN